MWVYPQAATRRALAREPTSANSGQKWGTRRFPKLLGSQLAARCFERGDDLLRPGLDFFFAQGAFVRLEDDAEEQRVVSGGDQLPFRIAQDFFGRVALEL